MLSLSTSETRTKSGANDREIDSSAKQILHNTDFTKSSRISLVQKAVERSPRSAISGDIQKAAFLEEVSRGHDERFLEDVLHKISYDEESRKYAGRCGYSICERQYLEHVERHVFGTSLPGAIQLRKCGISVSSSVEDMLKKLYTHITYYGETKNNIEALAERYVKGNKPSSGVTGIGMGVGGGLAFYGSAECLFVMDSHGNYGVVRILGLSGGFGVEAGFTSFRFKNIDTIFELESSNALDLGAFAKVAIGPLSIEGRFWGGDSDFGPDIDLLETRKMLAPTKHNYLKPTIISLSGQAQYFNLVYSKKVEK